MKMFKNVYYLKMDDNSLQSMFFSDGSILHVYEGDPDFGWIEERTYTTYAYVLTYTTYVKRRDEKSWWIHRDGGKPAIIAQHTKWVAFFEDGVSKKIEDVVIDELDRLVLALKCDLELTSEDEENYYTYAGEWNGD